MIVDDADPPAGQGRGLDRGIVVGKLRRFRDAPASTAIHRPAAQHLFSKAVSIEGHHPVAFKCDNIHMHGTDAARYVRHCPALALIVRHQHGCRADIAGPALPRLADTAEDWQQPCPGVVDDNRLPHKGPGRIAEHLRGTETATAIL